MGLSEAKGVVDCIFAQYGIEAPLSAKIALIEALREPHANGKLSQQGPSAEVIRLSAQLDAYREVLATVLRRLD